MGWETGFKQIWATIVTCSKIVLMKTLKQMEKDPQFEKLSFYIRRSFLYVILDKLLLPLPYDFFLSLHKRFFTLYSSFLIILTLHLSFIWDFTWVSIPSASSSDSLWVVVTKVSLFRCLLHINAPGKWLQCI